MVEQASGEARRSGISIDALVLVLVMGFTLHQDSFRTTAYTTPGLNAIAVGLLGLYLLVDVLGAPLLQHGVWPRRLFYGGKGVVLAGIVGLILIWPTCNLIGQRHATHPWQSVHDTSINVEEATTFLLAGKDPYAQTYFHTPLARFGWDSEHKYGAGANPALWWTDTFPGQELVTVPFMLAARATIGWFDERFVYLVAFALAVFLLLRLAPTPATRLALVAGVALNPLWAPEFIYGQNDILVLAEILAVLYFSLRAQWRWALLSLAVGCATKQTTLLLAPFYLWWLAQRLGASWPERLERLALLLPWLVAPFVLMVGPFAVWNWRAFYNGNFAYVAGTIPHSYPIQGFDGWGAASFVLWGGLVPTATAYYPFWIMQGAIALPLTVLVMRRVGPDTPVTVMLAAYATVLFPVFYFSRFFHASYVAFTVSLFLVAYFAHRPAAHRRDDGHLSFDVLAPLLLVPPLVWPANNITNGLLASSSLGLVLAYVVVAALTPWHGLRSSSARRLAALSRALLLAGLAYLVVLSRALSAITDRLRWGVPYLGIHDTALHTDLSAATLLHGRNPYTASFWHTPLVELYRPAFTSSAPVGHNLPLTHNPHLPLGFLITAPLQALFDRLGLLFDQGYVYVFAFLVMAVLLPALVQPPARQLALLSTVAFSLLFAMGVIQGQDDVLALLALTVALLLLQRSYTTLALFVVGVALALKLTIWPLPPLLLAYLAALDRRSGRSWHRRLTVACAWLCAMLLPVAITTLPFVLWNARAFWNDAVAYPLGLMRDAVPLNMTWGTGFETLGFGRVAVYFGWARADATGYIGSWVALGAGALVCGALVVRLWRAPSLPLLMAGYLVLLVVLEYFGRFMVDTSLGYLAILAPLSFFLAPPRPVAGATPLLVPVPRMRSPAVAV